MRSSVFAESGLRIRPRGRFAGFLVLPLALLVLLPSLPLSQEEEDLTAGLAAVEVHLKKGKELFSQLAFPEAIEEFNAVVETYEGGKLADTGTSSLPSVAEALDYRARAYFNLGDQKRAEADFAKLLRVKINYKLDETKVSPRVVDLFNQVKKENVGSLTLVTDPPGADAWLNDEPIGKTPIQGRPAMQGTYKLKLALTGYQDYQEDLIVFPRKDERREPKLTPDRRTLQFITQPKEVNVYIDDQLVGTTFGSPSLESQSGLKELGLDPALSSAPLLVPNVIPKDHQVRFERVCYQSQTVRISVGLDLQKNSPQAVPPVQLKADQGELKITSHPSGADVLIDGAPRGTTPVQIKVVCAGEREIRLVKGDSKWFGRVRIVPDVANLLDARMRPTLLYLGVFRLDEWGRLSWTDDDKALLEEMKRLQSVNQVRPDENVRDFRQKLLDEMTKPDQVEKLRKGGGIPPTWVAEGLTRFQADLLMVIITRDDSPGRASSRVLLYSSEQALPDEVPTVLTDSGEIRALIARLDAEPELTRPWIGATFADTLLGEGPVVVRVLKGGPAAAAGMQPGDEVLSVNGKPVPEARSLDAGHAGWKVNDALTFSVRRSGSSQSIPLTVGRTPVLVPLGAPARFYNKALCDYRQLSRGAEDPRDRQLALLNLGLGFIHFQSYDRALSEALNVVNLSGDAGISRGTIRFYQGLCYLKKDLVPEARTAFQEAAAAADATLESNDGPLVSGRARTMLQ